MLSASSLRRCIAELVAHGIVNYYPEGNKIMMYRILPLEQLFQKYIDHLAKTILNLLIVLQKV